MDLLYTHMFGSKVYVDFEISVDRYKTLKEAHAIAERIHEGMEIQFSAVRHIMIHVSPTPKCNEFFPL